MKNIVKIEIDKITGEKKIHNNIFSVLIFENIMLLSRGLMFEILDYFDFSTFLHIYTYIYIPTKVLQILLITELHLWRHA